MTCWLQVILIFIFHYLSYCSDALADFGRVGNPLLVSSEGSTSLQKGEDI